MLNRVKDDDWEERWAGYSNTELLGRSLRLVKDRTALHAAGQLRLCRFLPPNVRILQ